MTDSVDGEVVDGDLEDDYDGRSRRRRLRLAALGGLIALAGLGVGLGLGLSGSSGPPVGPEGVPLQNVPDLASANSTVSSGKPIDGITCRPTMDQGVSYHVHVHLAIFVNGQQERIPAGAGIDPPRTVTQVPGGPFTDQSDSSCLYWLHVHATDGIIHVEAPKKQSFFLGQFFDIWGQPLGPDQVGPAHGPVVAFLNGQRFSGDPTQIPLLSQAVIQLDVGTPVVAFKPMKFNVIGLCSTTCSAPPST